MSIKMLSEQVKGSRRELYVAYRTYRADITTSFLLQRQCPERKVSDARHIRIMETRVFIKIWDMVYKGYLQKFLHLLSQIFFISLSDIINVLFLNKVSLHVKTLCPLVYKLCEDIIKEDFPLWAMPLMHRLALIIMICDSSNSQDSIVGPNKLKSEARSEQLRTFQLSAWRVVTVWAAVWRHAIPRNKEHPVTVSLFCVKAGHSSFSSKSEGTCYSDPLSMLHS